jgi:hypothetical protein
LTRGYSAIIFKAVEQTRPATRREEIKKMATFQVNITITSYGETTIEADSLEEAKKLAEDLVAGDFDFIDGSDDEREVIPQEEQN